MAVNIIFFVCIIFAGFGLLTVLDLKKIAIITIIFIFFPVHIRVLGKDALTTGSVFVVIFYIRSAIDLYRVNRTPVSGIDYFVFGLLLTAFLSVAIPSISGSLTSAALGPAVRHLFAFCSSLLFFVALKNYLSLDFYLRKKQHEERNLKIINFIIILILSHVLITLLVKYIPSFGVIFKLFLTRGDQGFESVGDGEFGRVSSFVFSPESYGEILAVISPIVFYNIFKSRGWSWYFFLFLICSGLILAVTRSGIILFIISFLSTALWFFREKFLRSVLISYLFFILSAFVLALNPSLLGGLLARFGYAVNSLHASDSFLKIVNRDSVFVPAWEATISGLSVFGNGISEFHFHNLFLTVLHGRGVVGAVLFFIILFAPFLLLIKALKVGPKYGNALVFSCLLSMVLFFTNELKYEFTRTASYQQICWGLFAAYYCTAQNHIARRQSFTGEYDEY